MATTAAERKRKERESKKAQGLTQKGLWLSENALAGLSQYQADHKLSEHEAINAILESIKKGP